MSSSTHHWHFEVLDPKQLDQEELLSFLREEYGAGHAARPDYFDWCCLMNPAGRAVIPTIRDAGSGQFAAQNWLVPFRARVEGKERTWALGVNYLVRREYRRAGLMRSMRAPTAAAMADRGIELGLGFPNPSMVKAVESYRGSYFPDPLDIFVRPLDWSLLDQTRLKSTLFEPMIQAVAGAVWPLLFRPRPVDYSKSTLIVRMTQDYGSQFNDFWDRVQDKYPVMLVRDSEFLHWRYRLHPLRRYLTFVSEDNGVLAGYITIRSTELLGMRLGAIVDLLVEPSERGEQAGELLVAEAMSYFQNQRRQLVACVLTPCTQERIILRRQGFVAAPRPLHPQPVVMCFTPYMATLQLPTLCDIRNWFLTLGDYDII